MDRPVSEGETESGATLARLKATPMNGGPEGSLGHDGGSPVSDLLIAPDAPLPTIPPVLPAEITHVWAASTWDSGNGFRWSPDKAWERFAKVEP